LFIFNSQVDVRDEFIPEKCELFESEVYLEEVSDVICIAQAELPSLLALNQLAEALLRVKHGPWLLCQLVANAPDSFEQGLGYINHVLFKLNMKLNTVWSVTQRFGFGP